MSKLVFCGFTLLFLSIIASSFVEVLRFLPQCPFLWGEIVPRFFLVYDSIYSSQTNITFTSNLSLGHTSMFIKSNYLISLPGRYIHHKRYKEQNTKNTKLQQHYRKTSLTSKIARTSLTRIGLWSTRLVEVMKPLRLWFKV